MDAVVPCDPGRAARWWAALLIFLLAFIAVYMA